MSFNEDDNIIVHNIEEKVTWKEAVISATTKPAFDSFRSTSGIVSRQRGIYFIFL
jgi:hypothetical protein